MSGALRYKLFPVPKGKHLSPDLHSQTEDTLWHHFLWGEFSPSQRTQLHHPVFWAEGDSPRNGEMLGGRLLGLHQAFLVWVVCSLESVCWGQNNEKVCNIARFTKNVSQWAKAVGKMALIDLLDAGLPQNLQFVKNAVSAKHNKVKHNEMKCACISRWKNLFFPHPSFRKIYTWCSFYHCQISCSDSLARGFGCR